MSEGSDSPSKVDSDETNESQFTCPIHGCNQKFGSEASLTVHRQKHQMKLTLGPSKLTSLADVLPIDQTPTPTRFLHLGNQMGLFDELNPFDKEFKSAQKEGMSTKQRRAAAALQQLQVLSSKNKSPSAPTRNQATTSTDGINFSQPLHMIAITPTLSPVTALPGGTSPFLLPPLLPSPQGLHIPALPGYTASSPMQVPASMLSPTLIPFPGTYLPGMSPSLMADAQRAVAFTQAMFAVAAASASSTSTTVTSSSKETNNTDVSSVAGEVVNDNRNPQRSGTGPVPTLVLPEQEHLRSSATTETTNNFPGMESSPQAPQQTMSMDDAYNQSSENMTPHQFSEQLTNGQATGITNEATNISVNNVDPESDLANYHHLIDRSSDMGSNSNLLDAKQKLKATLTTNNPTLQQQIIAQSVTTSSSASVPVSDHKADPPARRRGRQSQDIDPDVKRQRFLERNRAAASRCRNKKKEWVNGLEWRAKSLSQTNIALQNEIAQLKDEVATLKQLLLSHRDCPITKMQQQQMALAGINLDVTNTPSLSAIVKKESSGKAEPVIHPSLASMSSSQTVDGNIRTTAPVTQQSSTNNALSNGPVFPNQTSVVASS